jgi:hypothetical protein
MSGARAEASGMTSSRRLALRAACLIVLTVAMLPSAGRAYAQAPCPGAETWTKVSQDEFRAQGLPRSQGVTSDGDGWLFSWQGGVSRTNDAYVEQAVAPIPADLAVQPQFNQDGTNHFGGNHIGDVDVHDGILYAPVEDGGQDAGVTTLNDPEYQRPYVALYDAKTLLYTGAHYAMPLELHAAGIPWIAVNHATSEVYTAEWDMPHDRINVFDLHMNFLRFVDLTYDPALGAGFRLSRIQGAKVFGNALYATRDDAGKSVFKIDLTTGAVRKLFSLNPGIPSELEGLSIRPTPDGALLHLLLVAHNDVDESGDFKDIAIEFEHFALTCE